MKIELVNGYFITPTEKRSIIQMIESGLNVARNNGETKIYEILKNWQEGKEKFYIIQIGTFGTGSNGEKRWKYIEVTIKIVSQPKRKIFSNY